MNPWDDDDILTDVWIEQAKKAWESIRNKGINFDIIISSTLQRAHETAKIIAKSIWYVWDIVTDSRLREQDAWVFVWKKRDDIKREFGLQSDDEFRRIFKSKTYNGVEDITEFDTRVREVYLEVIEKFSWKNILFVAHSWTSRALLRAVQDWDFEYFYFQMPWVGNCELIDLESYGR